MSSVLGCQIFPWSQIYGRQNQKVEEHLDEVLALVHACGCQAWEPFLFASRDEAERMSQRLQSYGLLMSSVYANVRLHEDDWSEHVNRTLEAASWTGAQVLVVNPEPINWNQPIDKDDAQLQVQARAMQALGEGLKKQGQTLAYHIHAPEMRRQAREFHATLRNTGEEVGVCLDAHWIFRGANDSQAAVDAAIEEYGARIVSLHLRQSHGSVWSQSFEPGDLDYALLAQFLRAHDWSGPVILEQAVEEMTPQDVAPEEAFRRSVAYVRELFDVAQA